MKWKVDKLVYDNIDVVELQLNNLSDSGWKIYKIHFDITQMGYDRVTIVSIKQ